MHIKTLLGDIFNLVFPQFCPACNVRRPVRLDMFCIPCLAELPQTGYHAYRDNPFERHFWGRVDIRAGAAYYFFIPGGTAQFLLHNIKYGRRRDVAIHVGRRYGRELSRERPFCDADIIVAVPLHWKKLHRRGFNQSDAFARGLSQSMGIPLRPKTLRRTRYTPTQTRLGREERVANMSGALTLSKPSDIKGLNVLLVDDVLTTGATLEACANLIAPHAASISLATIACGRI